MFQMKLHSITKKKSELGSIGKLFLGILIFYQILNRLKLFLKQSSKILVFKRDWG